MASISYSCCSFWPLAVRSGTSTPVVKFWVTWSLWRDKDQVQIEFADERVADDQLATVEKREAIRQKVSKVETVKNVRVIHRSEYVLTIANEDWGKNKEKVFDAMLEE